MSKLVRVQRLLARGEFTAAEAEIDGALESSDPREALVLGRIRTASSGPDQAMEVLDAARGKRPDYAPVHLDYAIAAWDAGKFAVAREALERVLALQPQNDVALSYQGLALLGSNQTEEARGIFAKHGVSDNRMFRVRLTEWMEIQWLEHNRFFFPRDVELPDSPTRPSMRRAEKLFYKKDFARVLAEVEPLCEKKPADEGFRFACAVSAEVLHDYHRAMHHLAQIPIENEESWPDPLRAARGRCRLRLRDFSGAADDLGKVLILGPEDFGLNYYLGILCLAHGEPARAREFFRRAHTDYMVDTIEFQFWQIEQILLRGE